MRHIVKSKEVQKYAGEYDSAREYLARWAAGVAEEAERQKGRRGEEVGIWGSGRSGWEEMSELGGFEVLSVAPPVRVERKAVLDERTWKKFFDHTGRLAISVTEVKEAVFHGVVPFWVLLMCRALKRRFGQRYGSFCLDFILGPLRLTNAKLSAEVNETSTSD